MVSLDQVVKLALACVLIVAVPGPSVLFVVGRALSYGRRIALASVLGNCTGSYIAAVVVALGFGPLLQRSELTLEVVRYFGAAVLLWLGVAAIRHSKVAGKAESAVSERPVAWRAVLAGIYVGLGNPKVFIVFAVVVPQFVQRDAGNVTGQMLLLSIIPIVLGAVTDSTWGLAADGARGWLAGTPKRKSTVGALGGVSMIALGLTVAVASDSR